MTSLTGIRFKVFGLVWACCALGAFALAPASAVADPIGVGNGAIFRLNPESSYQQGCFPPCLCPIMQQHGVRGTFKLRHLASDMGLHKYAVEDVNWTVPMDPPLRIIGAGTYAIGSPNVIPVLQQRMELDLALGDQPVQHFDSGWVPITDLTKINITVSINNMYCWDTAIVIDASRVPNDQIHPYTLVPGSTFQRGCYDPCDCILGPELPMGGTFALVPLIESLPVTEFAVVDVRWHVMCDSPSNQIPITGFGVYQLLGDFILQHRLALELVVGNEGRTHFDSGPVIGGFEFPKIDIVVSVNGMVCYDTVLHVVAEPVLGRICGGLPGLPCDEGEFCKLPVGHCCCDHFGICTPIPTGCPEVWDPVCGCDGVTYGNECEADMAAVSLAHYGECGLLCFTNADCDANNEFCKYLEGTCGETAMPGACTPIPVDCPDVWDPVCGCDGVTYSNECYSDAAAVSIRHRGPCEQLCSDMLGMIPCPGGTFCLYPDGTCDDGVHPGVCTPIPGACPTIWDPVCGCDGVTYSNRCVAHAAGVSIRHPGPCERICWFAEPFPQCGPGEFCKFPPGICDDPTVPGLCTPIPNACPEYYDPVCGCDGVTYSNECFADAAAVSIRHWGECEAPPCAATRMLSEPRWSYCPGLPKHVQIQLNPRPGATSYGLEDSPPVGWVVTDISSGGTWDPVNWKVKWGPFFAGNLPRSVGYVVIPPNDATGLACFSGTISIDGLNEPVCGDECAVHFCPPFMAADMPQPPCAACPVGDCASCPGHGCNNGSISLCEVIGYACAWRVGCNDDLAGMTRAAYIWRNGECYCWNEELQNWMPDECPPPVSGLCENGGGGNVDIGASSPNSPAATALIRPEHGRRRPGATREVEVTVRIAAPAGASAAALDFTIPDGWDVQTIGDEGQWDGLHRKVKWGPFFEDLSRTVTFTARQAESPKAAGSLRGRGKDRFEGFSGTVSFDGVNYPVVVR